MNEREQKILQTRLIPMPRTIEFYDKEDFQLRDNALIEVMIPQALQADAQNLLERICKAYWNMSPVIHFLPTAKPLGNADAYCAEIQKSVLKLQADTVNGLHNACKTLRQLAEPQRGMKKYAYSILQPCRIEDAPVSAFRGIHFCVFPETPWYDLERKIRLAAYNKYNYAIIEPWGVFPFQSLPELSWADKNIDLKQWKDLIRLGRSLGIAICPQFNLLGHAAAARGGGGKHAILDRHPELQPLFEPDGWTWCISNPETRKVLTNAVTELLDAFENPPYFHIGCDEAHNFATCRDCRRANLEDLLYDHITYFNDLIRSRGSHAIMWHDMLLNSDPKSSYAEYYANGKAEDHIEHLLDHLPRNIIIADWQYGYPKGKDGSEPQWPTNAIFKQAGFEVVACPWDDVEGIISQGKSVREKELFGLLQTTWHTTFDYTRMYHFFDIGAHAAWGTADKMRPGYNANFTYHVRQIGWDMGLKEYYQTGFSNLQIPEMTRPES